jgi:sec-independent protein translocase protein TatB
LFDIAFSEILVIAVVALIVIGPQRLPRVARTLGALMGRLQRYASTLKADIDRELQMEEIRRMEQEAHHSILSARNMVTTQAEEIRAETEAALDTPPRDKPESSA